MLECSSFRQSDRQPDRKRARKKFNVEGDGNSGPRSNWKTWGCDPPNREWLEQVPGTTTVISVQKSAVLATAKILRRKPQAPRSLIEDPSSKGQVGIFFYIIFVCLILEKRSDQDFANMRQEFSGSSKFVYCQTATLLILLNRWVYTLHKKVLLKLEPR